MIIRRVRYTDLLPLAHCLTGTDAEMLLFALDRAGIQFAWKATVCLLINSDSAYRHPR